MAFWFGRHNEIGKSGLVGPFGNYLEAKAEFELDNGACHQIGIFSAFDKEYAEVKIEELYGQTSASQVASSDIKLSPERDLPVRLREAYKLGQRNGENPYLRGSDEFNDFERARYKR